MPTASTRRSSRSRPHAQPADAPRQLALGAPRRHRHPGAPARAEHSPPGGLSAPGARRPPRARLHPAPAAGAARFQARGGLCSGAHLRGQAGGGSRGGARRLCAPHPQGQATAELWHQRRGRRLRCHEEARLPRRVREARRDRCQVGGGARGGAGLLGEADPADEPRRALRRAHECERRRGRERRERRERRGRERRLAGGERRRR
jgi:hypothetical protein